MQELDRDDPGAGGLEGRADRRSRGRRRCSSTCGSSRSWRASWSAARSTAPLVGSCARCLEPIEDALELDVQELFAYSGSTTEATSEEDEVRLVEGERIDLEPMVRDAVVLGLPLAPLCDEDCAGLCAECGQRSDDLPDDHTHEQLDPRWAGLAQRQAPPRAPPASGTKRRTDRGRPEAAHVAQQHPFPPVAVEGDRPGAVAVPEPRLRPAQAAPRGLPELRPVRRPPGPLGLIASLLGRPVDDASSPAGGVPQPPPDGAESSPAGEEHGRRSAAWLQDALGLALPDGLLALALTHRS